MANANRRANAVIDILLNADEQQNDRVIRQVEAAVARLRQELDRDYNIHIESTDLEDTIRQLQVMGVQLGKASDNNGELESLTATFKTMDDKVVTLRENIQSLMININSLRNSRGSLPSGALFGLDVKSSQEYLSRAIEEGRAYDSDGNRINSNLSMNTKMVATIEEFTAEQNKLEKATDNALQRLQNHIQLILKEQARLGTVGWQDASERLSRLNQELQEFYNQYTEINAIGSRQALGINQQDFYNIDQSGVYKQQETLYKNILNAQEKIFNLDKQIITADEKKVILLQNQRDEWQRILVVNQNMADELESSLPTRSITANGEYDVNPAIQYAQQQREIIQLRQEEHHTILNNLEAQHQREQTEKSFISTLNELESVYKQLATADPNVSPEYVQKLRERQQELEKTVIETRNNTEETEKMAEAYEKFQGAISQINVKTDNDRIKEALQLRKEQYKIEESLQKLINNHANPVAIDEERNAYQRAKEAAEQYERTELTTGQVIADNSKYLDENNKLLQQHASNMKQNDAYIQEATRSWSSFGQAIKDTLGHGFSMALSFNLSSQITKGIKEAINTVKELDNAMTQTRLVTGQTFDEVHKTIGEYAKLGQQLGATTTQIAEGTTEWLLSRSL